MLVLASANEAKIFSDDSLREALIKLESSHETGSAPIFSTLHISAPATCRLIGVHLLGLEFDWFAVAACS